MRGAELTDAVLCRAIREMEQGLIDADLGGGLVKKRVALPGRGKRGGARTILATNKEDRWFFLFGFEKNEMESIEPVDLRNLKNYGQVLLRLSQIEMDYYLSEDALKEICHD
jgi:hypothetical protein